jgi:Ca2+/Na+ antiporter
MAEPTGQYLALPYATGPAQIDPAINRANRRRQMNQTQVLGFGIIVLAGIGLYLHETCRLMPVMRAIYEGPSFIQFVVALIIFLAILTALPEPQSTYLAALVVISMLMIDQRVNNDSGLLGSIAT